MNISMHDDQTVICYCAGGLGNRLLPLASCWVIARATGRRLLALWREDDPRCQIGFPGLFSNELDIISDEELLALKGYKIYADINDVYKNFYLNRKDTLIKLIESGGIYDRNHVLSEETTRHLVIYHNTFLPGVDDALAQRFLSSLIPAPHLAERIAAFATSKGIDRTMIGVHARGTDFHVGLDQYAEKIRTVLKQTPNKRFLVCSDDAEYETGLHRQFGDRIILRPKADWVKKFDSRSSWINNTNTSRDATQEAVVDLFLLARTDFKIFHAGSSFARLVSLLQEQPKDTPPKSVPEQLIRAYTMNGAIPLEHWYLNDSERRHNLHYTASQVNHFADLAAQRKPHNYGDTDHWLYRALDRFPIQQRNVLVIGSQIPFYEGVCLHRGGRPVTVEFDKLTTNHPALRTMTVDEYLRSTERFDAAFSISSFEHTGLGRYGDPLDPDGDLRAMGDLRTKLKPDGLLFLAVPIGADRIVWNAHRVYGPHRLPRLLAGWRLLGVFGCGVPSGTYAGKGYSQPILVLTPAAGSDPLITHVLSPYRASSMVIAGGIDLSVVWSAIAAGMEKIYCIESNALTLRCLSSFFGNDRRVSFVHGTLEEQIPRLLNGSDQQPVVWIDDMAIASSDPAHPPYSLLKDTLSGLQRYLIARHRLIVRSTFLGKSSNEPTYRICNDFFSQSSCYRSLSEPRNLITEDEFGSIFAIAERTPSSVEISLDLNRRGHIYYFCPDIAVPSAGIRRIYRHVSLLNRAGFHASVLHQRSDFRLPYQPSVPITGLDCLRLGGEDTVVIPEGHPQIMHALREAPGRRFALALNWDYIFKTLPERMDWRQWKVERALVISPFVGNLIAWSMGIPYHLIDTAIDASLYYYAPDEKRARVVYIERKSAGIESFRRLLAGRDHRFTDQLEWRALSNLSESDYAAQVRSACMFVTFSGAEGFPTSCMEAMRSGTLVAGYDGAGGRHLLESGTNCILSPPGDYVTLAYAVAPFLSDIISGNVEKWRDIIDNGRLRAQVFTPEAESNSLISFWKST